MKKDFPMLSSLGEESTCPITIEDEFTMLIGVPRYELVALLKKLFLNLNEEFFYAHSPHVYSISMMDNLDLPHITIKLRYPYVDPTEKDVRESRIVTQEVCNSLTLILKQELALSLVLD